MLLCLLHPPEGKESDTGSAVSHFVHFSNVSSRPLRHIAETFIWYINVHCKAQICLRTDQHANGKGYAVHLLRRPSWQQSRTRHLHRKKHVCCTCVHSYNVIHKGVLQCSSTGLFNYHHQSLEQTLKMMELLLLSVPERAQAQQQFRSL